MLVEDVRSKFPIKTIPNIIGDTIYKAINKLRDSLYVNTATVPMMLGGWGGGDHIVILMDASVYENVSTTRYTRLTNPVPYAQHGPGDTAAARANANDSHKEERRVYDIDNNVDAALRQEVMAEVEETYLCVKKQRYIGFHSISGKRLLDHLMERYRKTRALDIETCRQAQAEPIEVDCLIDV